MIDDLFQSDPELARHIEEHRFEASLRDRGDFKRIDQILLAITQEYSRIIDSDASGILPDNAWHDAGGFLAHLSE